MVNFDEVIDRHGSYCTQWDFVKDRFGEKDLLPFTISDTDFAIADEVMAAVEQRLQHPVLGYTRWNHEHFKSAVYHWFEIRFSFEINEDWLMYSPSVIYSLSQLIQLKSDLGDGIVMQTPGYDAFFKTIEGNQRRVVENPLLYEEGHYQIDFVDLEAKLAEKQNKILLLCSPHNPTGRVWTTEELKKIVALCEKYRTFLITDEIHMDILRKGQQHHNILQFTQKNVALLTSGTKTFNFPGLGFSYLLLPDEKLREAFAFSLKNKDGLSSCSTLGMEATVAAYQKGSQWVDELNAYLDENITFVGEYLQQYLPEIKLVESEATYLLWLDTSRLGLSMEKLQEFAVKVGKIAIMDGKTYGGDGANFLRLNIGCPKSKLEAGLTGLKSGIEAAFTEGAKEDSHLL